jgi:integrase
VLVRPSDVHGDPPKLYDALGRYAEEVTPEKKGAAHELSLIRRWQKHPLAVLPLNAIRSHHLAQHRDIRTKAGISGSTLQKEFALISHLYRVAQTDWGYESLPNPVNGMRKPKVARGRDRRLQGDEEAVLFEYCDRTGKRRLKAVIVLALETAMRRSEMARLQWGDVDIRSRMAYLHDTKNGEKRTIPLSTRALAALSLLPKVSTRLVNWHVDVITWQFGLACKECGIVDLRFHDLRHEATSRLFEKGFNMMEVSTITGHKSLSMLKRYTHLNPSDLLQRLG